MYIPHTPEEISRMLEHCGMTSKDDLFADVPAALRMQREYDLPEGLSEQEVAEYFEELAGRNLAYRTILAGAGYYDHYAPAVIPAILSRSEFATSYTPYQPEISQGTLQYIFEYQTMMTRLTGLEVSNASMYDAATAAAEAMMMCVAAGRKKNRVLVSATVSPIIRNVLKTYARYHGVDLQEIAEKDGVTDLDALREALAGSKDIAGVLLPQPNFYGIVEDFSGVADAIHEAKALMAMLCPASTLAVLRTPGEWGADIACGDAQSLGIPLSYGGPYLGYMCTTKALMRKMPGRIVGATNDARGQRCFVLTLQAREQHIRRNKATSNICSNQGLMALFVTIYMSLMGPEGLREVNQRGHDGAAFLASELEKAGVKRVYPNAPFLNEFLVDITGVDYTKLKAICSVNSILPGVLVDDNRLLLAVTERQNRQDLELFVKLVKDAKK
ncbi:MAG: aminomethyl-transferring glycine dehydrogenase subunit GcvPA [Muribaculaceae bacterium]|nr:aminomethyl-transferring glycine dehydrogenase subunit GcvPA [Muribaculaceae bacterium]